MQPNDIADILKQHPEQLELSTDFNDLTGIGGAAKFVFALRQRANGLNFLAYGMTEFMETVGEAAKECGRPMESKGKSRYVIPAATHLG